MGGKDKELFEDVTSGLKNIKTKSSVDGQVLPDDIEDSLGDKIKHRKEEFKFVALERAKESVLFSKLIDRNPGG